MQTQFINNNNIPCQFMIQIVHGLFLFGTPNFNSPQKIHDAVQMNELNRSEFNPGSFMKGAREKNNQKV